MGRYCGGDPIIHREWQRALREEMGCKEWPDPDECCEDEDEDQEVALAQ